MAARTFDNEIESARNKDILSYLVDRGLEYKCQNGRIYLSSPFAPDRNWSFVIYPETNSFFDWSSGFGGDIIELVKRLESLDFIDAVKHINGTTFDIVKPRYKFYKKQDDFWKGFEYTKYLTDDEEEKQQIRDYANSRGIKSGYEYGVYFYRDGDDWVRCPSLMFLHRDKDLSIVGAKFRKAGEKEFSCRGKTGFYILENFVEDTFEKPVLYLVESETSANSLWQYFKDIKRNAVVISFGGVGSIPKELPKKYMNLKKKLIIDYDGNQELYEERLKNYEHLSAEAIEMKLPKGEDINSIYSAGNINLISNLII